MRLLIKRILITSIILALSCMSSLQTVQAAALIDLSGTTVTVAGGPFTYCASPITPTPNAITVSGSPLTAGQDYTVSYENNVNAGTGTVLIRGKGRYTGTAMGNYTISPYDLKDLYTATDSSVTLDPSTFIYSGTACEPQVFFDLQGHSVPATGYSVTYSNNINVTTQAVVSIGAVNGNFCNSYAQYFTINPKDIGHANTIINLEQLIFTFKHNTAYTPTVTSITVDSLALTYGTDYTYTHSNNTSAGLYAETIVTGYGNYTGTAIKHFEIKPKSLATGTIIDLSRTQYTYDGTSHRPDITSVVHDGITLSSPQDYHSVSYDPNYSAGKGYVHIAGVNNYVGTATVSFDIAPRSLGSVRFSTIFPQAYTGTQRTPEFAVTDPLPGGDVVLRENIDYRVSYVNNINVGTASAIITGIGNYTGTAVTTFQIVSNDLKSAHVALDPYVFLYSPGVRAYTPSVVVTVGGTQLIENTDYYMHFRANTGPGVAAVVVEGTRGYAGTIEKSFTIVDAEHLIPITDAEVTLTPATFRYDENNVHPFTPQAVVTVNHTTLQSGAVVVDKVTLRPGIDYVLDFTDNIYPGTARCRITGINCYRGIIYKTFTITAPEEGGSSGGSSGGGSSGGGSSGGGSSGGGSSGGGSSGSTDPAGDDVEYSGTYRPRDPKTQTYTTNTPEISFSGEAFSVHVTTEYTDAVTYTGSKIDPAKVLGATIDTSDITANVTLKSSTSYDEDDLLKVTYVNKKNKNYGNGYFYGKITITKKAKSALSAKQYQRLQKLVNAANKSLRAENNRCYYTVNKLSVTHGNVTVKAATTKSGALKTDKTGKKLTQLKKITVENENGKKLTLKAGEYSIEIIDKKAGIVRVTGKKNFTGSVNVQVG